MTKDELIWRVFLGGLLWIVIMMTGCNFWQFLD